LFDEGIVIGKHHWSDAWDNYIEYTIDFIAESEYPTIFWVARFKHPVQNNNAFWDMARLYRVDDGGDPDPEPGTGLTVEQVQAIARTVSREEIARVMSGAADIALET